MRLPFLLIGEKSHKKARRNCGIVPQLLRNGLTSFAPAIGCALSGKYFPSFEGALEVIVQHSLD